MMAKHVYASSPNGDVQYVTIAASTLDYHYGTLCRNDIADCGSSLHLLKTLESHLPNRFASDLFHREVFGHCYIAVQHGSPVHRLLQADSPAEMSWL